MGPILSIKADITGSEDKWAMARLLMGGEFMRAFWCLQFELSGISG
jgi:hypothetical protein